MSATRPRKHKKGYNQYRLRNDMMMDSASRRSSRRFAVVASPNDDVTVPVPAGSSCQLADRLGRHGSSSGLSTPPVYSAPVLNVAAPTYGSIDDYGRKM
ncbi:hypothetical protein ACEPAH_5284 [Sanghuangporus vaninii]